MLKSMHLRNFFGFRDTEIDLNPNINVAVGINGSGKTTLLKAIRILRECTQEDGLKKLIYDAWGGSENIVFKSRDNQSGNPVVAIEYRLDGEKLQNSGYEFRGDVCINLEFTFSSTSTHYSLNECIYMIKPDNTTFKYVDVRRGKGFVFGRKDGELIEQSIGNVHYHDLDDQESVLSQITDSDRFLIEYNIRKAIMDIQSYDYFDTTPTSRIRKPVLPTMATVLSTDGSNLPQLLNSLKINRRSAYARIKELLREVNPYFDDIDFDHVGTNIELLLSEKGLEKSLHISQISDGTIHFLCLLAILLNPQRGKTITIDEPEVGLHPDMMQIIAKEVQLASQETQFIISTHSAEFLNAFRLEQIKVVEKNEYNEIIVHSLTENQFHEWYEEFSPGQMWRKGDFGGNRW